MQHGVGPCDGTFGGVAVIESADDIRESLMRPPLGWRSRLTTESPRCSNVAITLRPTLARAPGDEYFHEFPFRCCVAGYLWAKQILRSLLHRTRRHAGDEKWFEQQKQYEHGQGRQRAGSHERRPIDVVLANE